jgi:glucose-6-phosphate 1-dehydrogenase
LIGSTWTARSGKFYEETGAIRDVIQNHLLQVVALIAMEPPTSMYPESVGDEQCQSLSQYSAHLTGQELRRKYALTSCKARGGRLTLLAINEALEAAD